jgi:hypothetical protein
MRSLVATFLFLVAASSPAEARTLVGPSVRIAFGSRHERGIGLRGDARGWHLSLREAQGATSVVLVDQTSPLHDKWIVPVEGTTLLLDSARFRGGHAYRVEVRRGTTLLVEGLVYLYPGRVGHPGRVELELDEDDAQASEEGIAIAPKSAL